MAQNSLKGKVIDSYRRLQLDHVSLQLIKNKLSTLSDSIGDFHFKELPKGLPDTLIVSMLGYKKQHLLLLKNESLLVRMELDQPHALAEVRVKASVPMSEDFINEKLSSLDIVLNASSKADPLLAVQSSSAASPYGESASISFRGSNPQLTQIYINDIPIPEPIKFTQMSSLGTFSLIPINTIKDLLIFPSNPPLELINASTGIVQIQSNETFVPQHVDVDLSMAQSGINYTPWAKGKNGINVFAHHQFSSLLKSINPSSLIDIPNFSESDWGMNAYFQTKNLWRIKLFSLFMKEKYASNFKHPSYQGLFNYQKNRHTETIHLSKLLEKSQWILKLGFSQSRQADSTGNYSYQPRKRQIFTGIDYQMFPKENWTIKLGYQWLLSETDYQITKPLYSFDYRPTAASIQFSNRSASAQHEVFLSNNYSLSSRIRLGLSLKWSELVQLNTSHLSKQIHSRWFFNPNTTYMNLAYSNQIANWFTNEKDYIPMLTEQISWDWVQENELNKWSFGLFYKSEKSSLNASHAWGFESNFQILLSKSKHEIGIGSHWSQINLGTNSIASPYQVPYFIRTQSQWKWKLVDLSLSNVFRAGTYYSRLISSEFSPELQIFIPQFDSKTKESFTPYWRTDAMLSRQIASSKKIAWIAYLSVSNVFNRDNVRSMNYSSDYQFSFEEYFQKRIIYWGVQLRL